MFAARTLLAAAVFTLASLSRAQISPGPLAQPHAGLEGNANCTRCHTTEPSGMDGKCLDCHREIGALIAQRRGLHAAHSQRCAACHPDHAGVEFALIEWPGGDPDRFDHQQAGWPLQGRHGELSCKVCHRQPFRKDPVLALHPTKGIGARWVGLSTDCINCHDDPHRKALGNDCLRCHAMDGFKPAPRFDHAKSSFPLRGAHQKQSCNECHTPDRQLVFKPVRHDQCSDCHRDPHQSRFGARCSDCHNEQSFHTIGIDGKPFEHDRTRFPLRGAHRSVRCGDCHKGGLTATPRPNFTSCGACHADAHAGSATRQGKPVDCAACHTVETFTRSTLTIEQHRQSNFPLEGKHQSVRCDACHVRERDPASRAKLGAAGVVMRPAATQCESCHADPHAGQLKAAPRAASCGSCHTVAGFSPSTFDAVRHAGTVLPLRAKHLAVSCRACHDPKRSQGVARTQTRDLGRASFSFTLAGAACESCHRDPHQGRFAGPAGCARCHNERGFRPSLFDATAHANCSFPLEGAHRAVPCSACHTDLDRKDKSAPLTLRVAEQHCSGCHQSVHGVQFEGRAGGDRCETCHSTGSFQPASRFDHQRDSRFPLDGAHQAVACVKCHKPRVEADGRRVTVYRPLSHRCEDCHGPTKAGTLERR
jgi:hypothetical protein